MTDLQKALEQAAMYKRMFQEEKLRADLLQKDLDAIDDFHALVESEIARSLNNRKVN